MRDVGSPERTTMISPSGSERESPERTGELSSSDGSTSRPRKEIFAKGEISEGSDALGGAARLEMEVKVQKKIK